MEVVSGIVVYISIWWLVFYMCLPFGIQKSTEHDQGFDKGAPHRPYIGYKILAATLIAAVIWLIVNYVLTYYPFDLGNESQ